MKAFAFALILFTLMLAFITYNYIYMNTASDELAAFAEDLTVKDTDAVSDLTSLWEEKHPFISLSTEESKEQKITDLLTSLSFYSENGNSKEFEYTKGLLINAFHELASFETFSFHDIF